MYEEQDANHRHTPQSAPARPAPSAASRESICQSESKPRRPAGLGVVPEGPELKVNVKWCVYRWYVRSGLKSEVKSRQSSMARALDLRSADGPRLNG